MPSPRCVVCGKATAYWCSRCQQSWYCSAEHLQHDWPRHRPNCGKPMTVPELTPNHYTPTPQNVSVIAIYFPTNEEKPRLITVDCVAARDEVSCPNPIVESWFPSGQIGSLTLTQGLNQQTLRFPLQVWYDNNALAQNTPINRAIFYMTGKRAIRKWSGPVVVLKFSGSRRQGYTDATLNDLPALAAYFLGFKY